MTYDVINQQARRGWASRYGTAHPARIDLAANDPMDEQEPLADEPEDGQRLSSEEPRSVGRALIDPCRKSPSGFDGEAKEVHFGAQAHLFFEPPADPDLVIWLHSAPIPGELDEEHREVTPTSGLLALNSRALLLSGLI